VRLLFALLACATVAGVIWALVATVRANAREAAEEYAWITGPQLEGTTRPYGQPQTRWVRAMLAHNDRADILRAQEAATGRRAKQRAERKRVPA